MADFKLKNTSPVKDGAQIAPIEPVEKPSKEELYAIAVIKNKSEEVREFQSCKHTGILPPTWSDKEVDVRNNYILQTMVEKGFSKNACAKYLMEKCDIKHTAAYKYIDEALDTLVENGEENKTRARALHVERLEDLYKSALKQKNVPAALKVLEQLGKVNGLLQENIVIAPSLEFNFGESESKTITINNEPF